MKPRIEFLLKITGYWLLSFAVAKLLFLLVNIGETAQLSFGAILLVFWQSLRMDMSGAAYFTMLPLLLLAAAEWTSRRQLIRRILLVYTVLVQALASAVFLVDAFLYPYWGFRLDVSPLMIYAQTPQEIVNFVRWWELLLVFLLLSLLLLMAIWGSRWFLNAVPKAPVRAFSLFWLLLAGLLILPIRGGLQQIPLRPGDGYFSEKTFANHATVNAVWNVGYSYTQWGKTKKQYRFFKDEENQQILQTLTPTAPDTTNFQVIDTSRKPNVLIIIVESFSAGIIPSLGGEAVAKGFEKLRHKGILFSNFYANGDRSEEGLLAILSGYPPLPMVSAAAFPDRTHRLPSLIKDFKQRGYYTHYYTGGEGAFANTGAYLRSQSIDQVTEKNDFPAEWRTTKWGVHDHHIFQHLSQELDKPQTQPFFTVFATLSSHEPFDVPPPTRFEGSAEVDLFRNAIAYTDQSLTDFIEALEQKEAWKNLWVIIVADHGHRLPHNHPHDAPKRFHIPMLWLGGALTKKDTIITDYAAQSDIPVLVAQQLGWATGEQYAFSKQLRAAAPSFAFYTYNNGFGFLTPSGWSIYDHNAHANAFMERHLPRADSLGKAYLQYLEADFGKRIFK